MKTIAEELSTIQCTITDPYEFRRSVINLLSMVASSVGTVDPIVITTGTGSVPAGERSVSFSIVTGPITIHGRTFATGNTYVVEGVDGRPLPAITPTGGGTFNWVAQK